MQKTTTSTFEIKILFIFAKTVRMELDGLKNTKAFEYVNEL